MPLVSLKAEQEEIPYGSRKTFLLLFFFFFPLMFFFYFFPLSLSCSKPPTTSIKSERERDKNPLIMISFFIQISRLILADVIGSEGFFFSFFKAVGVC